MLNKLKNIHPKWIKTAVTATGVLFGVGISALLNQYFNEEEVIEVNKVDQDSLEE